MRSELKHIENIENYLLGKLSKEEKAKFEFELANNKNLQEEIDLQSKLTNRLSILAFTNEIEAYHPEFVAQESSGGKFKWFLNGLIVLIIGAATSIAVFLSSGTEKNESGNNHSKNVSDKNLALSNEKETFLAMNQNEDSNGSLTSYSNSDNENKQGFVNDDKNDSEKKKKKKTNLNSIPVTASQISSNKKATTMEPADEIANEILSDNDSSTIEPKKDEVDLFQLLQVPFEEVKMQAHVGGEFLAKKSKSKFIVAPGILQHKNGKPVYGEVTIKYREFRNAAEMAFSEIPMTHKENGEEYNFNSAGMFEIRAYQEGQELKIAPEQAIVVDFNVTEELDSCYFWSLDDNSQKWKKLDTLKYDNRNLRYADNFWGKPNRIHPKNKFGQLKGTITDNKTAQEKKLDQSFFLSKRFLFFFYGNNKFNVFYTDSGYVSHLRRGYYKAELVDPKYNYMEVKKIKIKRDKVTSLDLTVDLKKNRNKSDFKSEYVLKNAIENMPKNKFRNEWDIENNNNVSEQYFDAGHTTPKLVQGLRCSSFGTYNCDAVGMLKNPAFVRASYSNSINDEEIKPSGKAVLSLIDLKQNAAFSFNPSSFTCSATGRNVLLLFSDNKIYALPEKEFSEMKIQPNGEYNFKLEDISDKIKSPEDLKKYLKL